MYLVDHFDGQRGEDVVHLFRIMSCEITRAAMCMMGSELNSL